MTAFVASRSDPVTCGHRARSSSPPKPEPAVVARAAPGRRVEARPGAAADLAELRAAALVDRLGARGAGAAEALSVLYRAYAPTALAVARRVRGQDQLAADATQEAFLGLWAAPGRYDPARGTVRAYLLAAVHHRAIDAVRSEQAYQRCQQHHQMTTGPARATADVAEAVTDRAARSERPTAVTAALVALPDAQRQVLQLMYFDGKTQQAIAAQLGLPLGTVKSRALLAMRRLRAALGPRLNGA